MPFNTGTFYRCINGDPQGFTFPVILLHGAGGSHLAWPARLQRIPGQRVFAPDLPAHGNSTQPPCRSMGCLVRSLHHFITGMGFYHVVLAGYSLGGALALAYASAFPNQVTALVSISCGAHFNVPSELTGALRKPADIRKALEYFNTAAFHPAFPHSERRKLLDPAAKLPAHVLHADFVIADDFHFNPSPELEKMPALIAGGAEDRLAEPSSLRQLHRYLKTSDLRFFKDAEHMLIYEKSEEIYSLVAAFLARVNPPG